MTLLKLFSISFLTLTALSSNAGVLRDLIDKETYSVYTELEPMRTFYTDNPIELSQLVYSRLGHYFNWNRMSRFVLARHWHQIDEIQRQHFTNSFRTLLLNAYAKVLLSYSYEQIEFLNERPGRRADTYTLKSITHTGTRDIELEYYIYTPNNKPEIIDVRLEGLSLLINYRKSFADIISQEGFSALLLSIDEKNAHQALSKAQKASSNSTSTNTTNSNITK